MSFNLADLFEAAADRIGDRPALVSGEVRYTYAQLDERADRLADAFSAAGIGVGDRIGVALRNGHEFIEALLAAFKIRAVPVNVDHRYVAAEAADMAERADLVALLHEPGADAVHRAVGQRRGVRLMAARGPDYDELIGSGRAGRVERERSGDDLYVLFTGGTTARPTGVIWRQEDLFFAALGGEAWSGRPVSTPSDVVDQLRPTPTRCLTASPLLHGTAQWSALSTLLHGGTLVLVPGTSFDPVATWGTTAREAVALLVVVGDAFVRPLVDELDRDPARWELGCVTALLSGGALLSPILRRRLLEHLPWAVVVDSYGTSETGGQGRTVHTAGDPAPRTDRRFRPRFHMDPDTAVLDEQLHPVEPGSGAIGRLARRGRVPVGYLGDDRGTAAALVTHRGQRWAITGDAALVLDDRSVQLLGRVGASVNSGGEKVFIEEVEAVIKSHPGVADAVVCGLPHERLGETVGAVVERHRDPVGTTLDLAELDRHCRSQLASFKVPRRVHFVPEVQRHPNGKPDLFWARRVLAEDHEISG